MWLLCYHYLQLLLNGLRTIFVRLWGIDEAMKVLVQQQNDMIAQLLEIAQVLKLAEIRLSSEKDSDTESEYTDDQIRYDAVPRNSPWWTCSYCGHYTSYVSGWVDDIEGCTKTCPVCYMKTDQSSSSAAACRY
jgi:hypothetical protein